ncbi:MAG: peptidylprolyl isomerase [Planctomycetales bacterium]|nr:peptidylprolyl isomerase [Planctomycetales bacterium]
MLILKTNHGEIAVELFEETAPVSSKNFHDYAWDGFYDGTIFHRVIEGFMIQGGGLTADLREKPNRAPIENEAGNGEKNAKYTLAMARTSDPNSATSQFFINVADNSFLDRDECQDGYGYAVFGRVVSGTEVVDSISRVATGNKRGMGDVPLETVVIESIEVRDDP